MATVFSSVTFGLFTVSVIAKNGLGEYELPSQPARPMFALG